MTSKDDSHSRLPLSVVPFHYALSYHRIDLEEYWFEGNVIISCKACQSLENRISVILHARDVQLHKAILKGKDCESDYFFEAVQLIYNKKQQTCEVIFAGEGVSLKEDSEYILDIDFQGILNDQMCGLYRSSYVGLDGKKHIMATTQFEATDARRAFPCFDEPAIKATFQLTVNVPSHLSCISNTPMASTFTTYDGKCLSKKITFQTTPKMSTYLLALVIGQFDGISQTSNQVVTTVYTVPGKAHQGQFCLDVATRCLDLYQELFQIRYPLPKSDLLAIPDFAAGAMENWGCVTYREAKILVQEGTTSESMKRGIARTVCHELAHQWFGNLTTMEFWTQLWLKEGVARYMEFIGIDSLFPDWNAWTEFVQSVYNLALSLDSMESSHPVEVEVRHPDEISEIFDAISYAKGASLIRMIASYIGSENFFSGMKLYLNRFAYSNAKTNDLWGALQEVSGVPVIEFMHKWTLEVGYPVLMVSDDGNIHSLKFLISGINSKSDGSAQWPTPVTAKVEGENEIQGPWVINGPTGDESQALRQKITDWTAAGKWFKLNVDQTGFFRVCYSETQWERLAPQMAPKSVLSVTDRLGLISDSFATGKAGYSSIIDSLKLISGFGDHESADYAVWQELSENLRSVASLIRGEAFYGKFQEFLKGIYTAELNRLGWDAQPNESSRTGTLRATVISMMGLAGDNHTYERSFDRLKRYASSRNDPSVALTGDLQEVIFRNALRYDECATFHIMKDLYEDPNRSPEEHRNCLSVMGCVEDPKRHVFMMDYIFNSGRVRLQDIAFPLSSLSTTTKSGGRASWQYLRNNFTSLQKKLGSGPMWGVCVGLCVRGLKTLDEANEVEKFFQEPGHDPLSAKRRLTQSLEIVRTQAQRLERDREALANYFS